MTRARGDGWPAVGVGFVGAGAIAGVHLDALDGVPNATLVGVVDPDAARAAALVARARRRHPRAAVHADVAALAAAGACVVHVLTPPESHAAIAGEALAHGCDVLVEKPLATEAADCDAIARAAAAAGRRVGVDHSLLADPQVEAVLGALAAGRVGSAVSAEYFCSAAYPPWADGPLPPHYRAGGHPFRDLGVHGLYLLRAVLGEIEGVEPTWWSRGGDPNLCFDEWDVTVRCAGGVGRVRLSWNVRPLQTTFTVHATGGTLRADVGCMFASARRARGLPHAVERAVTAIEDGWPALRAVPVNGVGWLAGRVRSYPGLRRAVQAFHARLADGGTLPADVADGAAVVRWVETVARPADDAKTKRVARHRGRPYADVLVTGASGMLGRRVVAALVADGAAVRVLCRRPPPAGSFDEARVDVVLGDLGDRAAVDAAVAGARTVVHAGAAMQGGWEEHARATVAGTAHVLATARRHGVARLVHVSSLSVLHWAGLDGATVTETAPLEPMPEARGAYTRAKLLAENAVRDAARLGLPAVVVRPGVLVSAEGPTLDAVGALTVGGRIVLLGDGRACPPLLDVDEAARALCRALRAPLAPGAILHVAGTQGESARAIAERLAAASERSLWCVPMWACVAGAAMVARLARAAGRTAPLSPYRLRSASAALRFDDRVSRALLADAAAAAAAGAAPVRQAAAPEVRA
jgi:predicted dehydrogenase/nucleoside-diphosphate-sugar epimerase